MKKKTDPRNFESDVDQLPEYLYRYLSLEGESSFERLEKMLLESKVYFSQPQTFNDPFDCNIPLSFKANGLKAHKWWREHIQNKEPNRNTRECNKLAKEMIRHLKTKEGKEKASKAQINSINENGMLCLSELNNSMLMWSYYASGHSGIVLRFNVNVQLLNEIEDVFPIKVDYLERFPIFNFYDFMKNDDFMLGWLGSKSKEWMHEKEWRLLSTYQSEGKLVPKGFITGVIFGLRTLPESRNKVRQLIEKSENEIELLQIVNKKGSFELEVVPA